MTPVDTWTLGAELRLTWNQDGYNLAVKNGVLLAGELGALGQSADVRIQPRSKGLLAALGRPEEDVPLRQLQATRGRHDVPERGPPRPLLAVGLRSVRPVASLRIPGRQRPSRERRPPEPLLRPEHRERGPFRGRLRPGARHERVAGLPQHVLLGCGRRDVLQRSWDATRIRIETGYPVIANGVQGFTINAQFLKVF